MVFLDWEENKQWIIIRMSLTMEVEKEYKSIRHIWYISVKRHVFAWASHGKFVRS